MLRRNAWIVVVAVAVVSTWLAMWMGPSDEEPAPDVPEVAAPAAVPAPSKHASTAARKRTPDGGVRVASHVSQPHPTPTAAQPTPRPVRTALAASNSDDVFDNRAAPPIVRPGLAPADDGRKLEHIDSNLKILEHAIEAAEQRGETERARTMRSRLDQLRARKTSLLESQARGAKAPAPPPE